MVKYNLRSLNKLVTDENTEITRFKGKYHVLHILHNGVPVPLFISENPKEIASYLKIHSTDSSQGKNKINYGKPF
jgi:hypothetical protein